MDRHKTMCETSYHHWHIVDEIIWPVLQSLVEAYRFPYSGTLCSEPDQWLETLVSKDVPWFNLILKVYIYIHIYVYIYIYICSMYIYIYIHTYIYIYMCVCVCVRSKPYIIYHEHHISVSVSLAHHQKSGATIAPLRRSVGLPGLLRHDDVLRGGGGGPGAAAAAGHLRRRSAAEGTMSRDGGVPGGWRKNWWFYGG